MKTVIVFLTLYTGSAHAVLNGVPGPSARTSEEALVRNHTVRILREADDGKKVAFCSGAINSANEILSAGHCFTDERMAQIGQGKIFVEVYDPKAKPPVRQIPIVAGRKANSPPVDLALLKTRDRMPPEFSVPRAQDKCDPQSTVYASGFGIYDKSYKFPTFSRIAKLRPMTSRHPGLVGFMRGKEIPCYGDSGGPIFCKVEGILSLVSVISHSRDGQPRSIPPDPNREVSEVCTLDDRIYGTDLSKQEGLINTWRGEMTPPALDAEGEAAR